CRGAPSIYLFAFIRLAEAVSTDVTRFQMMNRRPSAPAPADLPEIRKAAERGDAAAQSLMGVAYQKGSGVDQNFLEAVFWHRRAANQGNSRSQCAYLHVSLGAIAFDPLFLCI